LAKSETDLPPLDSYM